MQLIGYTERIISWTNTAGETAKEETISYYFYQDEKGNKKITHYSYGDAEYLEKYKIWMGKFKIWLDSEVPLDNVVSDLKKIEPDNDTPKPTTTKEGNIVRIDFAPGDE